MTDSCLRFRVLCPRQWSELHATNDALTRHCDLCARPVRLVADAAEVRAAATARTCIAVSADLARDLGYSASGPGDPPPAMPNHLVGDPIIDTSESPGWPSPPPGRR